MSEITSVIWRRLDTPGHDACRFEHGDAGFRIDGTAVFKLGGLAVRLAYHVDGDAAWRTRRGRVHGFVGNDLVHFAIERTVNGIWRVNGHAVPGLAAYIHLDFGFTPATNFPQIHQLDLQIGQSGDLPAAWMDLPFTGLQYLPQRYERRGELSYWYESPTANYAELLHLTTAGVIAKYPRLWQLEE